MKMLESISAVLGFRTLPTTILLVLLYATVFSTVLITDELPSVPNDQQGLDINQAYSDLHLITSRPHPYNSHSNDVVRAYIHTRLKAIASEYPHVHIHDDLISNASWASGTRAVYFEGTNLLVKIDGVDERHADRDGVLFSAHYDSVSTAPGTTDDGMGVVTLLQMVEYLAKRRPQRTAIFNINNGEEDGLSGAHAFLQHPWSKIPDTFLNLEGAAAGGRPIVFRSTSTAPLYAFLNKNVPHPHTNALSADAFARGAIRSSTDYSVYAQGIDGKGMEGLDFAFYRGRSKYHTKYDSIPGMEGGRKALWAMMEGTRGAGWSLLNDASTHAGEKAEKDDLAVYFDLFAAVLVVFKLRTLLTVNIVLLTVGPVVLVLLAYTKYVIQRSNSRHQENGNASESVWKRGWEGFKELGWLKELWKVAKFWLALVVSIGLQALLVVGYINLNPLIVYSQPYLVLASALALAYLSTVLTLNLPITAHKALPEQQKMTILLQTYIFTWILLLVSTIAVGKLKMGGVYWVTAWNIVVFVGSVLCTAEAITGAKGTGMGPMADPVRNGGERRYISGIRYEVVEDGRTDAPPEGEEVETEPTEITPLIQQQQQPNSEGPVNEKGEEAGAIAWWILQMLVVVPVPAILVFHLAVILLAAMPQTLADGSSPVTVYSALSLLAVLTILPMAPFSVKMHRSFTLAILALFIASTVYTWLAFPFSQDSPLKVFFQQKIELDLGRNTSAHKNTAVHAVTELTGVKGFLDHYIVPELPSSWKNNVRCDASDPSLKQGLYTCAWEGGLLPVPGEGHAADAPSNWLKSTITRLSSRSARLSVSGTNTRSCRLYFDNEPITQFYVHGPQGDGITNGKMQSGYEISEKGIDEIRLWSRTWNRKFVVDVEWAKGDSLGGRVACEWVEYASATAGGGGGSSGGEIPALEEVLSFLPKWTVVSKTTDGLVEAWGRFSV